MRPASEKTACPDAALLEGYALGTLAGPDYERVTGHLSQCSDCQARLAAFDNAVDPLLERLRQPVAEELLQSHSELDSLMARAEAWPQGKTPAAEDALGDSLGQYELLEAVGEGGMGTVYRARHKRLNRIVVIKVLRPHRADDTQSIARFEREMEAAARLSHPNIVRAHDAGEFEGRHYYVMEYVEGIDLSSLVQSRGPLAAADAAEVVRQTAAALDYAHREGLLHRDIKPSNLMLTPEGQVKVLDFGLARFESHPGGDITSSGHIMGTADYISPEQGLDSRDVDGRSDIYSLGCTLYFLLTGRPPFAQPQLDTFMKKVMAHSQQPVPPLAEDRPDLHPGLAALVMRMLAKDRGERPATAGEVATSLATWAQASNLPALTGPPSATPAKSAAEVSTHGTALLSTFSAPPRPIERKPLVNPAGVVAAVLLMGAGLFSLCVGLPVLLFLMLPWGERPEDDRPIAQGEPRIDRRVEDSGVKTELPRSFRPQRELPPPTENVQTPPESEPATESSSAPERGTFFPDLALPEPQQKPRPRPNLPSRTPPPANAQGGSSQSLPEMRPLAARYSPVFWDPADGGNGHYYVRIDDKVNWANAKVLAESISYKGMRGHLATITSPQENTFVSKLRRFSPVWIGLTDDEKYGGNSSAGQPNQARDGWVWVTGEPVKYFSWGPGRPHRRGQHYVCMYSDEWDDISSMSVPFIVEFEPGWPKGEE